MRLPLFAVLIVATAAVGCRSEGNAPTTAPPATTSVAPAPTEPVVIAIMPLGNSITQGDADHNTYRRPLWKSLEADGYDVDFVGSLRAHHRGPSPRADFDRDHEGHWGWRVDEILDRIRGWVEDSEPDILLIHLGSNDVFQGEDIESTLHELAELIDAVRESRPEATFLLAQIIPTAMVNTNARIRELNARIPELAASKSSSTSRVVVVDHFTGFDATRQTYDGVHPNADGEIHLSDRWLAALEDVLTP